MVTDDPVRDVAKRIGAQSIRGDEEGAAVAPLLRVSRG
jgi:hypothetical protein